MKLQTFVFVHDQKIILDYDTNNKFSEIENLKYVFLGNRPIDKLKGRSDIIVARDFDDNIEEHNSRFLAFSGWYLLWKNNLITADFVNLFEYDINLEDNFNQALDSALTEETTVVGYIPYQLHYIWIWEPQEIYLPLFNAMHKRHGINGADFVNSQPKSSMCSMTSNHTFNKKTFDEYMKWMEPMIPDLQNEFYAGHHTERSIMLYYLMFAREGAFILKDVLHHFQLDTHATQQMGEDKFNSNYENLIKNKK